MAWHGMAWHIIRGEVLAEGLEGRGYRVRAAAGAWRCELGGGVVRDGALLSSSDLSFSIGIGGGPTPRRAHLA